MSLTILSAVDKTGTTAAKFLSIGPGSRAVGMGGAFTSISTDASAMYWNPSGIARLTKMEVMVNHSNWIADISYDYIGFAFPFGSVGALGVNLTYVSMDEMDVTRYGEEDTGETFKAGQYALGFTYAKNLTDRFSIGFNGKYISEFIANSKASGLALDIGTLFDTPFGFRLGASISNFGPKMQMSGVDLLVPVDIAGNIEGNNESVTGSLATDKFDLPLLLRVGLSGDINFSNLAHLTWSVDANHPNDNSEYMNSGMELSLLNNYLLIRAGSKTMFMTDREEEYTFGAGIHYPLISGGHLYFDYAHELMSRLGDIHKFTLRIVF